MHEYFQKLFINLWIKVKVFTMTYEARADLAPVFALTSSLSVLPLTHSASATCSSLKFLK